MSHSEASRNWTIAACSLALIAVGSFLATSTAQPLQLNAATAVQVVLPVPLSLLVTPTNTDRSHGVP